MPTASPALAALSENSENLAHVRAAVQESSELKRKKATEVLVWLLSDTNRNWHAEIPHSLPVAYAMKGYSLSVEKMRAMCEEVLQACFERNIHVACINFDGQWIKMANRSLKEKPLTLLQLRKDVWEEAKTKSKEELLIEIGNSPVDASVIAHGRKLFVSSEKLKWFYHDFASASILEEESETAYVDPGFIDNLPSDAIDFIQQHEPEVTPCSHQAKESGTGNTHDGLEEQTSGNAPNRRGNPAIRLAIPTRSQEIIDMLARLQTSTNQKISKKWADKEPFALVRVISDVAETGKLTVAELDIINSTAEEMKKNVLLDMRSVVTNQGDPKIAEKWQNMGIKALKEAVVSKAIRKDLNAGDYAGIAGSMEWLEKRCKVSTKKSWLKSEKVNALSYLYGTGEQLVREHFVPCMMDLKKIATKAILKPRAIFGNECLPVSKMIINIAAAKAMYPIRHQQWKQACPFKNPMEIKGISHSITWFSYPELSDRRSQLEPKCLDGDHMLVNMRIKICKDGLPEFGISRMAWEKAAEEGVISRSLVCDLIDKQNNAFARKTFSIEVEECMQRSSFINEANFCKLVRQWYEAEDDPGIPALERLSRRLAFREFLLTGVDLACFSPPRGGYIRSMPQTMFEGLLQSIDTHIQLYAICRQGTYNQRSISSLVNETFFGEMSEMEPTKLGCPKSTCIPRLMSTVTEIMHYRHNPSNRTFSMRTARKTVYPANKLDTQDATAAGNGDHLSRSVSPTFIKDITVTSV